MNDEDEVQAAPVVDVAKDLREIANELYPWLRVRTEDEARSRLMPGGDAMAALGTVANMEAWENMHQATERHGRAYTSVVDEDPDEAWSAYQLLEYWSEQWRIRHGMEFEPGPRRPRPTVASEANFLRWALNWAWDHEPHWHDFARDVAAAKRRLEDILHRGDRSERGAPCMYEGCKGKRLVRKLEPKRDPDGRKIWIFSPWHCPSCHREWDDDAYARMVTAAHEAAKVEVINGEEWVSPDLAARRLDRPHSTIRQWIHRREVAVVCIRKGKRAGFVRFADVLERHDEAARRKRAS